MRVWFVKRAEAPCYYAGGDLWVAYRDEAANFRNKQAADRVRELVGRQGSYTVFLDIDPEGWQ